MTHDTTPPENMSNETLVATFDGLERRVAWLTIETNDNPTHRLREATARLAQVEAEVVGRRLAFNSIFPLTDDYRAMARALVEANRADGLTVGRRKMRAADLDTLIKQLDAFEHSPVAVRILRAAIEGRDALAAIDASPVATMHPMGAVREARALIPAWLATEDLGEGEIANRLKRCNVAATHHECQAIASIAIGNLEDIGVIIARGERHRERYTLRHPADPQA